MNTDYYFDHHRYDDLPWDDILASTPRPIRWEEVAAYIRRVHKVKISPNAVQKICNKLGYYSEPRLGRGWEVIWPGSS